jgi:hypothetical protein
MSITDNIGLEINGGVIELYRPIYNINSDLIKNAENVNIGQKQTYSITDTVLINDIQPSATGTDESSLFNRYGVLLNGAAYGGDAQIILDGNIIGGKIKNINISSDSDYVTKFRYTIDIETPLININDGVYADIFLEPGLGVSSISETKSIDIPANLTAIKVPLPVDWLDLRDQPKYLGDYTWNEDSGIFYNDTIKYSYDISFKCEVGVGMDSDIAADLICSRIRPLDGMISNNVPPKFKTPILTSVKKSSTGDGAKTLSLKYETVPWDAENYMTLNEEITRTNNVKDFYANRSYKITAKPPPNEILIHSGNPEDTESSISREGPFPYDVTGEIRGSSQPAALVNMLRRFFLRAESLKTIQDESSIPFSKSWTPPIDPYRHPLPGEIQERGSEIKPLEWSSVPWWNTKSMVITQNYNDNTASLYIDQTTQNIVGCNHPGYIIKFDMKKTDEKVIKNIPGWIGSGYIIQDMNAWKQTRFDYTVDVEYLPTNKGSGLNYAISMAKRKFKEIDICSGTGNITDYIISSNNNKCTLKITQYSGI